MIIARPANSAPSRFGFITPKTVGPAILRNRIRRRLRHLAAGTLLQHPEGWEVVVRVVGDCSTMESDELAAEWQRCLVRAGIS